MPLSKIKVIDLSKNAPGPLCTMILADYGADVIKIAQPASSRAKSRGSGQEAQQPKSSQTDDAQAVYNTLERSKRSISLNLKTEEGMEIFRRLVQTTDVIVTEFSVGTAERIGIGYEQLKAINPKLIYCAISGYGQTGPYRSTAGHDINYIATAGILDQIRDSQGKPVVPLNLMADYAGGGMHAALGILLALFHRERTGKGQFVDASMMEGALLAFSGFLSLRWGKGFFAKMGREMLSGQAPFYTVYETSDRKYICVGANEGWFWARLCEALGCEEYIASQWDCEQWPEIKEKLSQIFLTNTQDYWFERLTAAKTCVSRVNSIFDLPDDPHLKERGSVVEINYPDSEPIPQVGITLKFSEVKGTIRSAPPKIGQHTDEILRELGISEEEITRLHQGNSLF